MIVNIKHKGLKLFFEDNDSSKIHPNHREKLRNILTRLDNAEKLTDLNYPGSGLHRLSGIWKGHWALKVDKNFRVVFMFTDSKNGIEVEISDVDYLDYH